MNCGQFLPILSSADQNSAFGAFQFTPKNGNQVIIGGAARTIPGGVAVISGGVPMVLDDCIIEMQPNQAAAAHTTYLVYAFMDGSTMRLNLSTSGHKEDTTHGNQVNVNDAGQSLVGMIRTNADGRVVGGGQAQLMMSWFNPCHSVLFGNIGAGACGTYNTSFIPYAAARIEYLLFGINASFQESFYHPNIMAKAIAFNDNPACNVEIAVAIDGVQNGLVGEASGGRGDCFALSPGGGGKAEGYHYADFLIRTTAGTNARAEVVTGGLFTSPLRI